MIVGHGVTYCSDGTRGGVRGTMYPGTVVGSPSPGSPLADLEVAGIGVLRSVHQALVGPGANGPGLPQQPGSWAWLDNTAAAPPPPTELMQDEQPIAAAPAAGGGDERQSAAAASPGNDPEANAG